MTTKLKRDINKPIELEVLKQNAQLGNVPNVTTNNQTPTWSIASALNNIKSGETLSVIMSKVSKAIDSIILHIDNKSNPHGVTKSQIGLDNVENKSSVTIREEITKDNVTEALGYIPPTTLANLSSDSTHRTVTDVEKTKWNNKSDFSGNYNDLTDKPIIPSGVVVVDSLTSTSTTSSLSANQGKVLNEKIEYKTILSKSQPTNQITGDTWYQII